MYFFIMSIIGLVLLPSIASSELLSVQVKQTSLRSQPSFLGKSISKLEYAQRVENEKIENGWHFVKSVKDRAEGWVHESALSSKTIVLNSSEKLSNSSVSQSEVLMAGKGFNKEVETEYKKQNTHLNFTLVDKIQESKPLSEEQLIRFAKNGNLSL